MSIRGRKVIAAVREVAAERPTHVNGECVYIDGESKCGSCIIGTAMFNMGIIKAKDFLSDYQSEDNEDGKFAAYNSASLNAWFDDMEMNPLRSLNIKEQKWLITVQELQDGRGEFSECATKLSWGAAVKRADQIHQVPASLIVG